MPELRTRSTGAKVTDKMTRGTYGNGYIETTGYNNRMQVASISEAKGATTLLNKTFGYYDAAGP
jgi:hypothetical protein